MLLAAGHAREVPVWEGTPVAPKPGAPITLNPNGVPLWREGYEPIWRQNGVWTDTGGQPRLLGPDHFATVDGRQVSFEEDYLKPFLKRYTAAIRGVDPDAIIFLEGSPFAGHPSWGTDDPPSVVNAAHWYDAATLLTKSFHPDRSFDLITGQPVVGAAAVRDLFVRQLAAIQQRGHEEMGGIPSLIGEFGVPFDLDGGAAYETGDFSLHAQALAAYYDAMDANLLHCTIWNYTADNTNQHGDQWNGEDLSIFSRDQQNNPDDIHSGGRALKAIVRPYARATAGTPLRMSFNPETRVFEFEFRHAASVTAPTEIFVPDYQYPEGYTVTLSDGSYEISGDTLLIHHSAELPTHSVTVRP
ncbi:MAG: glycoside hydrolase family 5 protein [bacterium]|nr:glycoside hydrolase family 5 protein [bacterium]